MLATFAGSWTVASHPFEAMSSVPTMGRDQEVRRSCVRSRARGPSPEGLQAFPVA